MHKLQKIMVFGEKDTERVSFNNFLPLKCANHITVFQKNSFGDISTI